VVSRSMLRIGRWEPRLFYEVLARLQSAAAAAAAAGPRPPVFLDIGANLGAFAVPLASAGHRVIAFEALAANLVALRRSLCRNPALGDRVLLFDKALGASAEHDCVFVSTPHNKARGVPAWQKECKPVPQCRAGTPTPAHQHAQRRHKRGAGAA